MCRTPPESARWGFCEQDWPCCWVPAVWLAGRARPAPVLSSGEPGTAADTRSSPFRASRGRAAVPAGGTPLKKPHSAPIPGCFPGRIRPPQTPPVSVSAGGSSANPPTPSRMMLSPPPCSPVERFLLHGLPQPALILLAQAAEFVPGAELGRQRARELHVEGRGGEIDLGWRRAGERGLGSPPPLPHTPPALCHRHPPAG